MKHISTGFINFDKMRVRILDLNFDCTESLRAIDNSLNINVLFMISHLNELDI